MIFAFSIFFLFTVFSNAINVRTKTDVVVFVPSVIENSLKRISIYTQYKRDHWPMNRVTLLFIMSNNFNSTDSNLISDNYFVKTPCQNKDRSIAVDSLEISSTTCKVYYGLLHIYKNYRAKYVWRIGENAYLNLRFFFDFIFNDHNMPIGPHMLGSLFSTMNGCTDSSPSNCGIGPFYLRNTPIRQIQYGHLFRWPDFFSGMGYCMSWHIVQFIASLTIMPYLHEPEDVIVSFWLLPFQIKRINLEKYMINRPNGVTYKPAVQYNRTQNYKILLLHYMQEQDWQHIADNGDIEITVKCLRCCCL